jgi:hypothetical protein
MDYRCRTMTRDEIALAIDWAAQEGWNPGLHDAASFHEADPEGFFVGLLGDEPVASISVVKYGTGFAFLGLYIVLPAWRGRGFGWTLWRHAMATAGARQLGLDGVVAQQPNYRKSGFDLAWRNVRWRGTGLAQLATDPRLVRLPAIPFDTVAAYDQPFFPADRRPFLRHWLAQGDATALGCVARGRLQGWGLVRRCRSGWKIGPLLADSEEVAETLFTALAGEAATSEAVHLDLPEPNAAAVALARRHGMEPVFETARMYTGTAPSVPMERLYGVTTFELG